MQNLTFLPRNKVPTHAEENMPYHIKPDLAKCITAENPTYRCTVSMSSLACMSCQALRASARDRGSARRGTRAAHSHARAHRRPPLARAAAALTASRAPAQLAEDVDWALRRPVPQLAFSILGQAPPPPPPAHPPNAPSHSLARSLPFRVH